jgi:hypothetical protein
MLVDRAWVERNLGFDPISKPPPASAFATAAAARKDGAPEDLQREIIDFDSEGPEGAAFLAFSKATGLNRFTDIKWPSRLAPQTGKTPAKDDFRSSVASPACETLRTGRVGRPGSATTARYNLERLDGERNVNDRANEEARAILGPRAR